MLRSMFISNVSKMYKLPAKCCCSKSDSLKYSTLPNKPENQKFATVFAFPFVKYLSIFNRLKVYQMLGSALAISICGPLEALNVTESGTTAAASYIGVTGTILLSLSSLMTKDVIGFIYVSENEEYIKISYVSYWGKRIDTIIPYKDWTPLSELPPKATNVFYLNPMIPGERKKLKLLIRYGHVLDSRKMNAVIE